jgi:hypothetical protein
MSTGRFHTCGVVQGWQSALDWAVGSCQHRRSLTGDQRDLEGARLESEVREILGEVAVSTAGVG